jgi:ankyrin repeat protein
MTPIMWACLHNRPKHVKKLLQYGADLDEKDLEGKTAAHWVGGRPSLRVVLSWAGVHRAALLM